MMTDQAVMPFALEDRQTRALVRDLHGAKPAVYWTDLLMTALVGWTAFAVAVMLPPFTPAMLFAALVAVGALYRALCFIHEISHQSSKSLPGFELAWNLLVGYPLLMPSFVYVGVHPGHHKLSTYGTIEDPEYLPFAGNSVMTVLFALESFFIPVVLVLRFVLLSVAGLLLPSFQRWLTVYLSSLTMNVKYRRDATPELVRAVRLHSTFILLLWAAFAAFMPWRFFVVWLGVSALVSFVNTLRTLGAHAYESTGDPLDREGQLLDSIDTPGAWWTEFWAPVGLRYHALHHYFPGIPYHNLPQAWTRIAQALPSEAVFHRVQSRGLHRSLRTLYLKGSGRFR